MINSSAIEIFRTFSKEDLKEFNDFVLSPFFNKKKSIVKLFRQVKKFYPEFKDEKKLHREILWKSVYPGKEYNYGVMKNLIYDMNKLGEHFLEIQMYNRNYLQKVNYVLLNFKERSLIKLFMSKVKQLEKYISENKYIEDDLNAKDYYLLLSDIYRTIADFEFSYHTKKPWINQYVASIEYLIKGFMISIVGHILTAKVAEYEKNYTEKGNSLFKIIAGDLIKSNTLEKLYKKLKESKNTDYVILEMSYFLFKAAIEDDPKFYFEYKNLLTENIKIFSRADLRDLMIGLRNSLYGKDRNKLKLFQEYCDIDKLMMTNCLFQGIYGELDQVSVMNSIHKASINGDIELIESVLNEYVENLPTESRNNIKMYALAQVEFLKKNYPKSLEYISQIKIDFLRINVNIRFLQTRLFYELKDFNSLEFALDSFRHFIKNYRENSEQSKEQMNIFCKRMRTLYRIYEKKDLAELLAFQAELNSKSGKKTWFKEKIQEIMSEIGS